MGWIPIIFVTIVVGGLAINLVRPVVGIFYQPVCDEQNITVNNKLFSVRSWLCDKR